MRRFNYYLPIVFQKIAYVVFFLLYKLFVKIEIRGKEHLLGISRPIILTPNHTHELDVTAIPLVLPFFSSFLPIYFVANSTEKFKTFGWRSYIYGGVFFNLLGGYAVYSGHKNYAISLDNHIRLLRKKQTICIFPEGKRTRDGQLNPARGGLGYLVHTTGATVVPITIDTFFNMSVWDFFTRRRKVIITVCTPIPALSFEIMTKQNPTVDDYRGVGERVLQMINDKLE